jgi:transcriptional regulator with XRE-family HTH domain
MHDEDTPDPARMADQAQWLVLHTLCRAGGLCSTRELALVVGDDVLTGLALAALQAAGLVRHARGAARARVGAVRAAPDLDHQAARRRRPLTQVPHRDRAWAPPAPADGLWRPERPFSMSAPSPSDLGRAIRELRKQRKMTIEALAFAAQLHPTYLSGIERGRRNPSWAKICALAGALGTPITDLALDAERAQRVRTGIEAVIARERDHHQDPSRSRPLEQ